MRENSRPKGERDVAASENGDLRAIGREKSLGGTGAAAVVGRSREDGELGPGVDQEAVAITPILHVIATFLGRVDGVEGGETADRS